jgi:hypothetical protein
VALYYYIYRVIRLISDLKEALWRFRSQRSALLFMQCSFCLKLASVIPASRETTFEPALASLNLRPLSLFQRWLGLTLTRDILTGFFVRADAGVY